MATEDEVYDHVIVGAGVTGTYCGYQLWDRNYKENCERKRILILEKTNRVGGLLKSELVNIDNYTIKQEEGGMRFTKNSSTYTLCKKLDLEIVPFKSANENNLNHIRGIQFTNNEATNLNIWHKLYNTGIVDTTKSPYDILMNVFEYIRIMNRGIDPQTPECWQNVRLNWMVDNIPLYKWDFELLLRKMGLTYETIKMIQYSIGFRSLFNRNCNAGFGFQSNLDFTEEANFCTLKYGFDFLPVTLAKKFTENGGEIRFLSEVTTINEPIKDDDSITVQYAVLGEDRTKTVVKSVRCKNLILALPKISLQKLATTNDWFNKVENFNPYVNSVISQSLTKINLYYDKQWWAQFKIFGGGNFTDLKLGSVYVFSPILEADLPLVITLANIPG